jgi:hypothetical protein
MKRNKLQLKKTTLRVLLDESSLRRVAGGLTVVGCTGGPPTAFCPTAGCSVESDFGGHCSYDCTTDTTSAPTITLGI